MGVQTESIIFVVPKRQNLRRSPSPKRLIKRRTSRSPSPKRKQRLSPKRK